jgi:hypothetical protein
VTFLRGSQDQVEIATGAAVEMVLVALEPQEALPARLGVEEPAQCNQAPGSEVLAALEEPECATNV